LPPLPEGFLGGLPPGALIRTILFHSGLLKDPLAESTHFPCGSNSDKRNDGFHTPLDRIFPMSRPFAILIGLAGLSLTAGCADIMRQSAVSQIAPERFAEKAVEVKGEGYPELLDVPQERPFTGSLKEWKTQADQLKTDAGTLEATSLCRKRHAHGR